MNFAKMLSSSLSHSRRIVSTVSYVTDIEGNYDYWLRYVSIANIFEPSKTDGLRLKDSCHLVFGGDVCDRGPGDIRLLKDLTDLSKNHPGRVHFILGNRDINKMRFPVELHHSNLNSHGKVYWIDQPSEKVGQSAADRLKWMLAKTMGSPLAFEYRRQELEDMESSSTDEDVVQSFLDSVKPEGVMTNFLEQGKVALVMGDCLFVHGALKADSIGWLPPFTAEDPPEGRTVEDLHEWVDEINRFVHLEVQDFKQFTDSYIAARLEAASTSATAFADVPPTPPPQDSPSGTKARPDGSPSPPTSPQGGATVPPYIPYFAYNGCYDHPMPGSRLMQYGMGWMPDKAVNKSAIYANFTLDPPVRPAVSPRAECSSYAPPSPRLLTRALSIDQTDKPFSDQYEEDAASTSTSTSTGSPRLVSVPSEDSTVSDISASSPKPLRKAVSFNIPEDASWQLEGHFCENDAHAHTKRKRERVYRVPDKLEPDQKVAQFLRRAGVRRVFVGHQPRGDAPLVLQHNGVQVLSVDTSYAVNAKWEYAPEQGHVKQGKFKLSQSPLNRFTPPTQDNTRGVAVTEVLLSFEAEVAPGVTNSTSSSTSPNPTPASHLTLHGRLSNGLDYAFALAPPCDLQAHYQELSLGGVEDKGDCIVGRKTPRGWYVKAANVMVPPPLDSPSALTVDEGEPHYLLCALEGFLVRNRLVKKSEIEDEFDLSKADSDC